MIVHLYTALISLHCNENPIYVFLFWELRGLSPNFHIHVSVSDLYIPRIGPHISCSRIGGSIVWIYKSLTDTWIWKLRLWPRNSFSGNICFKFLVLVLCSAGAPHHAGRRRRGGSASHGPFTTTISMVWLLLWLRSLPLLTGLAKTPPVPPAHQEIGENIIVQYSHSILSSVHQIYTRTSTV